MTSIFAATAGTRSTSRQRYELAGSDPICAARCSVQHRVAGSVRSGVDLFRLATASGFLRRSGSCRQYLCRYCGSRRRDDVPASSPPDYGEVATPAATLERPPVLCPDVFVCVVAVAVFCCSSRASSASAENGPLPDDCGNGAAASVLLTIYLWPNLGLPPSSCLVLLGLGAAYAGIQSLRSRSTRRIPKLS